MRACLRSYECAGVRMCGCTCVRVCVCVYQIVHQIVYVNAI